VGFNYLDLFSGIGGFSLAARWAGLDIANHYHSDISEFGNKVYRRHFPGAISLGDIRGIDGRQLKKDSKEPWIICGGFPCQDISTAGSQRGITGSRSGLWWEMHRIIDELRPEAVLIENVSALRNKGLERVLFSLASIGFDAEWETVSAAEAGAPHLRKRVWIAAYPHSGMLAKSGAHKATQSDSDMGDYIQFDSADDGKEIWTDWQTITSTGLLHGVAGLVRVDDGLPAWVDRIAGCGNAIVPQVATPILSRMKSLLMN
jgi:DNA (cytosine-5)-methyltransferase 1